MPKNGLKSTKIQDDPYDINTHFIYKLNIIGNLKKCPWLLILVRLRWSKNKVKPRLIRSKISLSCIL